MVNKSEIDNLKNMNTKGELAKQLLELQETYNIAMKEINNLQEKRKYWENKYKKLEEDNY